jgi:hypothetical protein
MQPPILWMLRILAVLGETAQKFYLTGDFLYLKYWGNSLQGKLTSLWSQCSQKLVVAIQSVVDWILLEDEPLSLAVLKVCLCLLAVLIY